MLATVIALGGRLGWKGYLKGDARCLGGLCLGETGTKGGTERMKGIGV